MPISKGYSQFIYSKGDYSIDAHTSAFFPEHIFNNDTTRNIEINCVTATCRIDFNITPVVENTTLIAEFKDFHSLNVNIDFKQNGSYSFWFYNREDYQVRVLFTVKQVVYSSIDPNLVLIGIALIVGASIIIFILYYRTRRKKELPFDYLIDRKDKN
ncbi:MAG: hypothetical protein ACW967_05575 [Candidatus Hodarchaeales archaeon]